MPSDKDRLYIALYARGGSPKMPGLEDTSALIVGPQNDKGPAAEGTRFHAKEVVTVTGVPPRPQMVWTYEEKNIALRPTALLLVRIVIGKEAMEVLLQDGKALGTSAKSWTAVRDMSMQYVAQKKAAHRFDGKGNYDLARVATWDMLEGKEIVP
ncbi:hypothetical protein F5Y16DRAFT_411254 [Xylariaceae sp. FL0255]|nr:hypothetical protein F5Y16DRAFT_411254 [Xylariaceae sp. FL0255]